MTLSVWIGDRVRERRNELHITQEELAECADITQVMVSQYERGTHCPTAANLIKLADALNVSTDWLLGRDSIQLRY